MGRLEVEKECIEEDQLVCIICNVISIHNNPNLLALRVGPPQYPPDLAARVKDSPKSYARPIHTYYWILDKETIVERINPNDEIEKPLPPPSKLNLTPLANVAQLTPTPSAEIGILAKMEKEEYPVILGRNIGISSYQGRASTVLSSRASDSFSASSTPLIVASDPHKVTSIAEMTSQTSVGVFNVDAAMSISDEFQKFCVLECPGCNKKKRTKDGKPFDCPKCLRKMTLVPRCYILQLLRLDHIHQMLCDKLFNMPKKSSWVSANLTRTSLTIVSFAEKEQLLPLTIDQRNAKKVRPLATSELGMEPTIVESGSSSAALALEPLTPAKKN
ncbi:hypothetical protein CQW23_08150 [Capsicum baccatum]|uniref:Uncharacterized protein n=1 Tax=Capsicum baccatum TaxID=33114 RepID=A0A2G2X874_CAPBA|nr:hypothetical protein CQW23_08150 [Capsicum baccatum]